METYVIIPFGNGQGEPMVLMPWQTEWIEEVYQEDIKSAAMSIARSNGKTGLCAGLALADAHLDTFSPEVWLCAVTVGQLTRPSGLFGVVKRMTEIHPDLTDRTIVRAGNMNPSLLIPVNNGVIMPVSTRNEGSMQGGAVSLAIADELAHLDPVDWQSLVGAGLKRTGSKVIGISTPGRPESALHVLRKAVLSRKELPGFHWTEFAAPDGCALDDLDAWKLANPSYGITLNEDALKSAVATVAPFLFRQYHLGQWQEVSEESWLGPEGPALWDSLTDPYEPQPKDPCWMGVDVSLKFDSTSVVSVFERPDGRFHASAKVWYPGSGVVDQALVRQHIPEQADKYRVASVAFDPRFWVASAQDLDSEGIEMIEIAQSPARMVPIVGAAYTLIAERKLTHTHDPTFRQQVLSAIPRPSEAGFTLYKQRHGNAFKIDAAIALCMALSITDIVPASGELVHLF
jgi:phage terminase large subunit-like protein